MINELFWKVHTSSVLRFVQVSSGGITRPAIEREEEAQGWWGGWSQYPRHFGNFLRSGSKQDVKQRWLVEVQYFGGGFGGGNAIVHPRWSAGLDWYTPSICRRLKAHHVDPHFHGHNDVPAWNMELPQGHGSTDQLYSVTFQKDSIYMYEAVSWIMHGIKNTFPKSVGKWSQCQHALQGPSRSRRASPRRRPVKSLSRRWWSKTRWGRKVKRRRQGYVTTKNCI